jgi:repressor LexA
MASLYENVKKLCDEHGVTPGKMCIDAGVSKSIISDLKAGRKKSIALDTAQKIADYFNVTVTELLNGTWQGNMESELAGYHMGLEAERMKAAGYFLTNEGWEKYDFKKENSPTLSSEGDAVSAGSIRIPVLGSIPAGIPLEAIEDIVDWEEIPAKMANGDKEYFGLRVKGDSMYPDFLDGDTVIVHKTPVCRSGDVCVVYVNGYDATLKQVKLGENGTLTLVPKNPSYPPRTYSANEIASLPVSIAGVVIELRRRV